MADQPCQTPVPDLLASMTGALDRRVKPGHGSAGCSFGSRPSSPWMHRRRRT